MLQKMYSNIKTSYPDLVLNLTDRINDFRDTVSWEKMNPVTNILDRKPQRQKKKLEMCSFSHGWMPFIELTARNTKLHGLLADLSKPWLQDEAMQAQ